MQTIFNRFSITVLGVALVACGEQPASSIVEPTRPAIILQLGGLQSLGGERFPGRVRAEKRAELSFNVPGFLEHFDLREGTQVRAGQEIARLEANVYRARVNAARAEFDRAKTDLERYQRLFEGEQAVAKSEVDDRKSRLEVARTNLATVEQELSDTVIRAPFSGALVRRRVETFTNVQAKQVVADIQDLSRLEVVINVPERIFRQHKPERSALAYFSGQETKPAKLQLKSYAIEADPQTQSYEVVLGISESPDGMIVLPGMSASVVPYQSPLDRPDAPASAPSDIWIPLTAIASVDNAKRVWTVDDDGRVSARVVETGQVSGGNVHVVRGLATGDRVVAAGVQALRDGMKVRPLE
jgi:membrane fusion protein, multidrug efflux system